MMTIIEKDQARTGDQVGMQRRVSKKVMTIIIPIREEGATTILPHLRGKLKHLNVAEGVEMMMQKRGLPQCVVSR